MDDYYGFTKYTIEGTNDQIIAVRLMEEGQVAIVAGMYYLGSDEAIQSAHVLIGNLLGIDEDDLSTYLLGTTYINLHLYRKRTIEDSWIDQAEEYINSFFGDDE